MKRLGLLAIFSASLIIFISTSAWGYDAKETGFNFNSPGARANAMGGAFIGLADDATAAFTNPAGLVVLTRPELALEYKYTKATIKRTDIDEQEAYSYTNDVSFLSFSYPHERFNFTVYRHQLVDQHFKYIVNQPYLYNDSKTTIVTYGLAGAYKVTNSLSMGLGVGFNQLDFYIAQNPLSPTAWTLSWTGSNTATSYTVSALWSPSELFNLGLVYRYGPKFEYEADTYYNDPNNAANNGSWHFPDTIKVPDFYGVGISSRPLPGLTISMDYNYILYSQMSDYAIGHDGKYLLFTSAGGYPFYATDFKMDDTYELRAGLEYAFTLKVPMAVRAGYAFRPDHQVYVWDQNQLRGADRDSIMAAFPHGSDEHVVSVGYGIVLKNIQFDFAYTYSDLNQNVIGSMVVRF